MNWLIYIGGWFFGWAIWNSITGIKERTYLDYLKTDWTLIIKLITWTMTWIWICWRFI